MFDFADPYVVALANDVHHKLQPSGVVVWLMRDKALHVVAHTNSPIDRDLGRVLQPQYTIGHLVCEVNKTLVINDTLSHPLVGKTAAVKDMGIMAYLGTPFHCDGVVVGGISAVHQHARRWETQDVTDIEAAAQSLSQRALQQS
jgi:GAF domain-containing protein